MRTRLAILAVLGLSGLAAPAAFADDPPPITVPTPTVPTPQPDPGPVAKPKPRPAPRPTRSRPAATPSPRVTPTYTPTPAIVTPHPQASHPVTKKKAAVKHKAKAKAKPKPVATKPAHQGVKGAEKTHSNATAGVASHGTSSSTGLLRMALLLAVASILGVIAVLFVSASSPRAAAAGVRRRRARPREVAAEVIRPKALSAPTPMPPERPAAAESAPPVREELGADQLLADIAPPVAEPLPSAPADTEVTLEPEPVRARPPFHEPALGQASTAREERLLEEQVASLGAAAALPLQSAARDADEVPVAQPVDEICEIGIWRGYVKSRFYAGLVGVEREGIEFALAESQPVRVRGTGTPERTGATAEAHEALVNYLIESGWEVEPSRNGEGWYALRFRRAAAPAESSSA